MKRSNRQTQGSNGQKAGEAGAEKQVKAGFLEEGTGSLSAIGATLSAKGFHKAREEPSWHYFICKVLI